jgi:hypothetical protein
MAFTTRLLLSILKILVDYFLGRWKTDEIEEILFPNATSFANTEDSK